MGGNNHNYKGHACQWVVLLKMVNQMHNGIVHAQETFIEWVWFHLTKKWGGHDHLPHCISKLIEGPLSLEIVQSQQH